MSELPLPGQPIIDIVLPTYHLEPSEKEKFYPSKAKIIIDKVLKEELVDKDYDEDFCRAWSLTISDKVREGLQELLWNTRYKVVVQTTIGQMRDQGVKIASRCLWDPNFDNYATSSYSNHTLFCNVLVFA
eukprot:gene21633-27996_t